MKPTVATAITAMTVAIVPRSVPSSHRTADTSTPEPAGSANSCACAEAAWKRPAIAPAAPIILLFAPPIVTLRPCPPRPSSTTLSPAPRAPRQSTPVQLPQDRDGAGEGQRGAGRLNLGGRRNSTKKKQ